YAALELEKVLARHGNGTLDVTLVTRDNFFLFTPMLHEVAASDLELNTIVNPLRKLLRRVNTFVGGIEALDLGARRVTVSHGREALRFYPNLREDHLRMVLVTPDPIILPELGPQLGAYAQRKLAARGVEIITGMKVRGIRDGVVELTDGRTIRASTLVWTAGTAPNPLIAGLPLPKRGGRVLVDEYLALTGCLGVWALGDCALVPDSRGGFQPPTAQHALREGRTAARNVAAAILGRPKKPFRFRTLGQLAAIGRRTGVANVFGIRFSGFVAWWLWRTIYLS